MTIKNTLFLNTFINFKMSNFEFENVIDEKFRNDEQYVDNLVCRENKYIHRIVSYTDLYVVQKKKQ